MIYAHREDSDFHENALSSLVALAESGNRWALPWPCLHAFLAITTHPRIFDPPTPMEMAIEALKSWLVPSMGCEVIGEELGYFDVLSDLVVNARITGPAVHDARVAAICLHNGVRALWTADRDFSRFGALKTHNPVAVA